MTEATSDDHAKSAWSPRPDSLLTISPGSVTDSGLMIMVWPRAFKVAETCSPWKLTAARPRPANSISLVVPTLRKTMISSGSLCAANVISPRLLPGQGYVGLQMQASQPHPLQPRTQLNRSIDSTMLSHEAHAQHSSGA